MPAGEWATRFRATDDAGEQIPAEQLPLTIALQERRPAHMRMYIVGLDNVRRRIETTAIPLIGQAGRHLGAAAVFWEVRD
jgi:hypothetical protein